MKTNLSHIPRLLLLAFISTCAGSIGFARAGEVGAILDDIIKETSKVPVGTAMRSAEDVVDTLSKNRGVREAIEEELTRTGKLTEGMDEATRGLIRANEVEKLLKESLASTELLGRVELLNKEAKESALVLARGGQAVKTVVPDMAFRSRLLSEGGPETVAAIGLYGQDAARSAFRLQEAIAAGNVISRDGSRAVKLIDFGKAMTQFGDGSWKFWSRYVQPHWKVWLASGALAAYLIAPTAFQDAAGRITQAGMEHLTKFVGKVSASAIAGVGEGVGEASHEVAAAIHRTYLSGPNAAWAAGGTVALACLLILLLPRVRHYATRPFRWLMSRPVPKP